VRGDKDVGVEGNGETENAPGMLAWIRLNSFSNTIIVLVSSELACFVRTILQREENKGVEHTGAGANCL